MAGRCVSAVNHAMSDQNTSWHTFENVADVPSPALLVYPERVEENIRRMIRMAVGLEKLRPHVKTHKLAEVVRLQMAQGVTKFKCATIAELEMVAGCGAADVLFAYQPVGPTARRLVQLAKIFPQTRFAAIADDAGAIRRSPTFSNSGLVLICSWISTGNAPHRRSAAEAIGLYRLIANSAD